MPRDKIKNLNDILFAQLERLDDEELTDEQLSKEIKRSNAINRVSTQIIASARLQLEAAEMANEYGREATIPEVFSEDGERKKITD